MLSLNKIEIENFGPYKDKQSIVLSPDPGVTIVYGENMRGKTLLLNAIRYALFGKVLGRGSRELSIHQLSNWEKMQEGVFGFKVVLFLEYFGDKYEITRESEPRAGIKIPKKDNDYSQSTYIKKNNKVLGPKDVDIELTRIMPENISRFFLFDGELLQEYEELLRDESEMGVKIKNAIERILGVPILINARIDLKGQVNKALTKFSVAAQKNRKTQELGNQIQHLNEKRDYFEQAIADTKENLEKLNDKKNQLNEQVRQNERVLYIIREKDQCEKKIEEKKQQIKTKQERIKEISENSWLHILNPSIENLSNKYAKELKKYEAEQTEIVIAAEYSQIYEDAIKDKDCPVCKSKLSSDKLDRIETLLAKVQKNEHEEKIKENIKILDRRVNLLNDYKITNKSPIVLEILDNIDELSVEIETLRDQLAEYTEQSQNFDQSELRQLVSDREKAIEKISLDKEKLSDEEKAFIETNRTITKLEKRIEKIGGESLEEEQRLSDLCNDLHNLFSSAVDLYRDQLREKVETSASALFLELTSEPEYAELQINDNYGLSIVHNDGNVISIRSSGAEHVVALALMGSLQQNSPLHGPIIMDSPFGRLDAKHTSRIVKALPNMADQVMLLVYESELDKDLARETLLGKLRGEYILQRVSAKHTNIEPLTQEGL